MTKKDYELVASGIAETYANRLEWLGRVKDTTREPEAKAALRAVEQVAADISARLRDDNAKYDAYKFMCAAIYDVQPMN